MKSFKEFLVEKTRHLYKQGEGRWIIKNGGNVVGSLEREPSDVGTVYHTQIGSSDYEHSSFAGASDKIKRHLEKGDDRPTKMRRHSHGHYHAKREKKGGEVKNKKGLKKK